jgi:hypothetical protein
MVVGGVTESIDELLALDLDGLSDRELHDQIVELERESTRLAAVRAQRLSMWDARKTWADDRSKAASARLARECRLAPSFAQAEMRRACRLRTMPVTEAAFADGALSVDHVDALIRTNQPRVAGEFAEAEAFLVSQGLTLSFTDFLRVLAYWLQVADVKGEADKAKRMVQGRHFDAAQTFCGSWDLSGNLDPISGTQFVNELTRLETRLFEEDWAAAKAIHGDDTRAEHLKRTPTQRRSDALVLMAQRSRALPDTASLPAPLITVLVNYETFKGRLCETEDGTVIDPSLLLPLLSEADIERIVFESPSRVIDVGVRRRFFTGATRRAIEVRDRHCQHPGCEVPASRCQVDHIIEYTHGGLTIQANGRLLCSVHNRTRRKRPPPPDTT